MHPAKSVFLALTCCCTLVLLTGCAGTAPVRKTGQAKGAPDAPSVALVVRLAGGGTLSPAQLRSIHEAMQTDLKAAGYRFARNTPTADFLITIRFTPDALTPDTGHIAVMGVQANPMNRRGAGVSADVSEESREHRQRMREIERWVEAQGRSTSS
jgi:hypothetical protein